ncbi:DUF1327 domain-containing protein [Yersinia rochesterensis]|uniref:DUF1327 domain-containing protein n=1 Tax=Yersinia rochesterensis TaxID=1604335 RepID=UPI0028531BA1|nr:DUF1327 domain-containing protein [Yersinia rochesterensis]MDR5020001.1 DUF1327 domain-containing protein [Yersinia rochesterensis]
MTKQYELSVKYITCKETSVDVTVALSYSQIIFGEILSINCCVDKIDGESLEYYESTAIKKVAALISDVANDLKEAAISQAAISTSIYSMNLGINFDSQV